MSLLGEIMLLAAPVVGTWKPVPAPLLDLPYVSLILDVQPLDSNI